MGDVNSFLLFLTTDSFSPGSWIHHVCCGNWKVISCSCQMLPATDSSSIPSMFAEREEKNVSAGKVKFSIVDFFYLTTKLPNNSLVSIQTQLDYNRQGITSKDEQHQIWNHFSNLWRAFPVLCTGFGWKVNFSTVDFLTTKLPDNLLILFPMHRIWVLATGSTTLMLKIWNHKVKKNKAAQYSLFSGLWILKMQIRKIK